MPILIFLKINSLYTTLLVAIYRKPLIAHEVDKFYVSYRCNEK